MSQVGDGRARDPGDEGDEQDAHNDGPSEAPRHEDGHDGQAAGI